MAANVLNLGLVGGLGIMASPMARHWKKAGPVRVARVHDRKSPGEKRDKARLAWNEHGAELVPTYEALVGADLDGVVVCAGKNGDDISIIGEVARLLGRAGGNKFICHMSTVSAGFAESAFAFCRSVGVQYVNYPLTGGALGAEKGTLLILASGDRALFDRLSPYLAPLGTPRFFGEGISAGAEVKFMGHLMVFNGLMGISSAAALHSECFQEGAFGGNDQLSFFDFLNGGAGGTRQWEVVLKSAVRDNDWESGFLLKYAAVDAIYTAQLCWEKGLSLICADAIVQMALGFSWALGRGGAGFSTQALARGFLKDRAPELNAFIKQHGAPRGEIKLGIEKCVASFPEPVRKSVKLSVSEKDFS